LSSLASSTRVKQLGKFAGFSKKERQNLPAAFSQITCAYLIEKNHLYNTYKYLLAESVNRLNEQYSMCAEGGNC
jgi:hypothetical protein